MKCRIGDIDCPVRLKSAAYNGSIVLRNRQGAGLITIDENNLKKVMKMSMPRLKNAGYGEYLGTLLEVHDSDDMPEHRLRATVADAIRGA